MTIKRRLWAAGATSLGVLLVAPAFLAPAAGAKSGDLAVYSATAVARGVDVALAVRPHTLDPLGQVAAPFVRTELNTIPQSNALASVLYPGDLVQSVGDEEGPIGNPSADQGAPVFYPGTVKARYPDKQERRLVLLPLLPPDSGVTADTSVMEAVAKLARTRTRAVEEEVIVRAPGSKDALVTVEAAEASSEALKKGTRISQVAASRAEGVELLGGMIRIESLRSVARAVSDGTTVVERDARLEIGRTEVIDSSGEAHRAVIDQDGIRIEDPDAPQELDQTLTLILRQTLGKAGVTITTLDATTTAEGAAGSAFSGGLLIDFSTGGCAACTGLLGLVPVGVIPDEAFAAIEQVTTRCEPMEAGSPVCFSLGLVPSASNSLDGRIVLASAAVSVAGALAETFGSVDLGGSFGGGVAGTGVLGGGFTGTTDAGFPPGGDVPPGTAGQTTLEGAPAGQLFGLVSEIPSGALAGVGAGFLAFAVALLLRPSLRP